MNRGLAALPVQRFQGGGPAIGLGGLTAPIASIGPISVTPADIMSIAIPAIAPVNTAINAINAIAAMNAQQAPAPVSSVESQIAETVAQEATDATDAAAGLAAMNATNAEAQAAESAAESDAAATAAMAEAVADSVAAANAADAAAAAAAASDGGVGGAGGDGGAAGGDSGAGVGGTGDSSGDGSGGERAGGLIGRKHYQFGGSVMGMGDAAPRYAYAPIMMAEGGLAAAAQNLQNKGRGDDSVLVHMTPGEVKGLQALAMAQGGSLTINPTTGLPEAGVLRALLPAIAGAALNFFAPGVGTAIGSALGASSAVGTGIAVGGLTALATGSLKQGLLAGLGAYGGAGLSEGLVTPATPSTSPATIAEGSPLLAKPPAATPIEQLLAPKPIPGATSTYLPDTMLGSTGTVPSGSQLGMANIGVGPTPAQAVFPGTYPSSVVGAPTPVAIPPVTITPDTAVSTAITPNMPMAGKDLFKYGSAALTPVMAMPPEGPTPSPTFIRPYKFASNPIEDAYTPAPRPGDTSERRYFNPTFTPMPIYRAAAGGQIDPDYNMETGGITAFSDSYAEGGSTGLGALAKKRKSLKGDPYYKFADSRRDQSMEAAIEQNFARGGVLPPRFLSGGGDGMSDSIKANIDGKQEARLADGEFVVPADVVSHLGNGSSKAGAKKLYAMMDKIRKARTGSKRQAPEVNAAKYMPA